MVNQQLLEYIKTQESQGFTSQQLYDSLIRQGQNPEEVKEAINYISKSSESNQLQRNQITKKGIMILLIAVFIIAIGVSGYFIYENISRNTEFNIDNINSGLSEGECHGFVNRNEIGGTNLTAGTAKGFNPVDSEGKFILNMSTEGAQLAFVSEGKELRATGISLASCDLVFDAKSTAKASVFMTPGILSTDIEEAKIRLGEIEQLSCFDNLHSFLQDRLKTTPLNEITISQEYNSVLEPCITEMYEKAQQ